MELYLMQHGLAYSKEDSAQRALCPEGVLQVQAAAKGIRQMRIGFDLIITSPKRRAQQTAALVAEAVRYPYSDIMTSDALLPQAVPAQLMTVLEDEQENSRILIVGHLPHLKNLLLAYTGCGGVAMENAGLACVLCEEDSCQLISLMTNHQLTMIGK